MPHGRQSPRERLIHDSFDGTIEHQPLLIACVLFMKGVLFGYSDKISVKIEGSTLPDRLTIPTKSICMTLWLCHTNCIYKRD